ncbi:hypothetical protein Emtol_1085 [Emticicia oligotrophica DSM 17448]|uniref:Uncharacterized protein n=1 Tax=Emticicia oligotrophica (strain DSM 17448 / CIP 109782 / MTCC 6937 / GPTSA100-15) TaxID=929562 RepID=A0ABM5MYS9_EMTOG|nr:hypothetical protein [Emticicia oligotrophica]AFK02235.1 hypothetical protein Emtol_1085 [Emticicia oligotrophica DSM 17448]
MKKLIYVLVLPLVVLGGLVFANREIKKETPKISSPKKLTVAEMKAARKQWEASPDGVMYKKWEESPAGKKVYASAAKVRRFTKESTNMEGVITSLSLPAGSRLGFGVMVKINGEDYILAFGQANAGKSIWDFNDEFEQLRSLKINDKVTIKSHVVSYAPKYAFPILAGDYVERDSKIIYKRAPRQGGC